MKSSITDVDTVELKFESHEILFFAVHGIRALLEEGITQVGNRPMVEIVDALYEIFHPKEEAPKLAIVTNIDGSVH